MNTLVIKASPVSLCEMQLSDGKKQFALQKFSNFIDLETAAQKQSDIDNVLLVGPTSYTTGLKERLEERLGVPVKLIEEK